MRYVEAGVGNKFRETNLCFTNDESASESSFSREFLNVQFHIAASQVLRGIDMQTSASDD